MAEVIREIKIVLINSPSTSFPFSDFVKSLKLITT